MASSAENPVWFSAPKMRKAWQNAVPHAPLVREILLPVEKVSSSGGRRRWPFREWRKYRWLVSSSVQECNGKRLFQQAHWFGDIPFGRELCLHIGGCTREKVIDTKSYSSRLRERAVILSERRVLIARLRGSEQEKDISTPLNCRGYGRIHEFRWYRHPDWSPNPLPMLPAAKALGVSFDVTLSAQVFQNAACNWRCWYCFVDSSRLSANVRVSEYFTADELISMYLEEKNRPNVIDLSGGQPDIVPEWLLWTIESVRKHGLEDRVFLWSDDNLSTRYFWEYLTPEQRRFIAAYPKYSRVACFKGYDEASFSYNTLAQAELFIQQFEIYRDLLNEGLDMYAYVTFTALPHGDLHSAMKRFVDKLQEIHPNLPLRTVPLKIQVFMPTKGRMKQEHKESIVFQHEVHAAWLEQLNRRFGESERNLPICDVPMSL